MKLSSGTKLRLSRIRSLCNNENGAVLVIGLMFIAILAMLGTTAVVMTTTDMQIGGNYKTGTQAFWDADAGVNYGLAMIEAGLKASPATFTLPTEIYDPDAPTNSNSFQDMTAIANSKPSEFSFEYADPGLKMIAQDKDRYSFTTIGAGSHNSSATITVMVKRGPAITMGLFGDDLVHVHNSANAYSYSHSDEPNPNSADSTGEAGVGSNVSVILKNSSLVDGSVTLGEKSGTDATLTEYSGASYLDEDDVDWVDPDPLGIVGGDYATKIATYSASNLNCCGAANFATSPICDGQQYVFGTSSDELKIFNEDMLLNNDLTLKGKSGGANYYFTEMILKSGTTLYIDTTDGPVNIYLTGGLEAKNNSNIINTKDDSTCPSTSSTGCSCGASCGPGAPSDFSLFANSTSDSIIIKNSAEFHGLIYAPYMAIELKNSASAYGAIMGKTIVMHNSFDFYFDTDLNKNGPEGKDLERCAWENVRD